MKKNKRICTMIISLFVFSYFMAACHSDYNLGVFNYNSGNYEEAITDLEWYLEISNDVPEHPEVEKIISQLKSEIVDR